MNTLLPQPKRLVLLFVYTGLLLGLSRFATGIWFPGSDARGLWFYSGAFAFLTAALLDAPTHVTPKQAFLFSSVALTAVLGFGSNTWNVMDSVGRVALAAAVAFEAFIFLASTISILWKDTPSQSTQGRLAGSGYVIAIDLGHPGVVTAAPFLFAILAYHLTKPIEALTLVLGCAILVLARPLENLLAIAVAIKARWEEAESLAYLGEIVGHQVPHVVTVRHSGHAKVDPGTLLLVTGDDGKLNLALALSYMGIADGLWLRALQLDLPKPAQAALGSIRLDVGTCALVTSTRVLTAIDEEPPAAVARREDLLGLVSPNTDTHQLRFELIRSDQVLDEGQLVEVDIGRVPVLFQVLEGLTREDVIHQKNTRGYVEARARKIGAWSESKQQFNRITWVPGPNTPVFFARSGGQPRSDAIGHFPGTSYPIFVDPNELVTHNTAILGILGVGKTFLSLELVERMIRDGIRVLCFDLTDQYADELVPYLDRSRQDRVRRRLQEIGDEGKANVQRNVEEGGSVNEFRGAVLTLMQRFLDPAHDHRLFVINPNDYVVWRQDSKPYQDRASMASLSAAEITQILTEAALEACQGFGMTSRARCCLVYEEAHSLIPEWSAVVTEGDKTASNGTARAILQGRKFGLGCVVVTQRTASVTKTVLNQCNTVFAMRVFDATGMDFLANYIGTDYASVLSGLKDRHGVLFGRASSCSDPVMLRFNDRDAFLESVRSPSPGPAEGEAAPSLAN